MLSVTFVCDATHFPDAKATDRSLFPPATRHCPFLIEMGGSIADHMGLLFSTPTVHDLWK